jgi:hypothetical protein
MIAHRILLTAGLVAGSILAAEGEKSWSGGAYDGRVRRGRSVAAWPPVPGGLLVLAQAADGGWQGRKGAPWRVLNRTDKRLETLLVDASPAWLTRLPTAF